MNIQEYQNKQTKKLIKILGKMKLPSNPHTFRNLGAIIGLCGDAGDFIAWYAYNYGYMQGKRAERDVRKWGKTATFHNMHAYAKHHDGKLPASVQELYDWITARARKE